MIGRDVRLVGALVAHHSHISFDRFSFIETYATRIGLDKAAIEDSARQTFVIVGLNGFEVAHRNARLIGYLAQSNASLLARESQLLTDSSCHHQSAALAFGRLVNYRRCQCWEGLPNFAGTARRLTKS